MTVHGKEIKIFTGNSNTDLSNEIALHLGIKMGNALVTTFCDGEISVNIHESVRGDDVFVIQSVCHPVNNNLMELLIMIDAFKRASAGQITAVIPYYGYARQDRKAKARDPITAKLIADLITSAGADRVLTMDLHAPQIQGFFNIPLDHLIGGPILAKYFIDRGFLANEDVVVVSPDLGSVSRARSFAQRLNVPLAIIDKRRPKVNMVEIMNVIGDIENKRVLLIDDLTDTAGTLAQSAHVLMANGAKEIYACCTHAVLSGEAIRNLAESPITEMVITNTIPLPREKHLEKIKVLSVAPIFAEAIKRIYEDVPVSPLFA